jgi:hypothetical protein
MKFDSDALQYLSGSKFSTVGLFQIAAPQRNVLLRLDYLESISRGQKVIHVGFADHLPIIAERMKKNEWLHQRLLNVADRCLGIDIEQDAVAYVQQTFGMADVYVHDLGGEAALPAILEDRWDYMILGEIVEHLDNPVAFLAGIRAKYAHCVERLVVTVPNAFRASNVLLALGHKEQINTDHRFWFTPYTLAKVAVKAGYTVEAFEFCASRVNPKWHWHWVQKRYPALRDGIIMVLKA